MATERLYYRDSHLIEFEARVVDQTERVSGWTAVTLDRTAFYPTGGGQPSDTGILGDSRVVECIDDEQNGILHVIQGRAPAIGSTVKGRVDWLRRLDHMQQHTGQHILSQAFVSLFHAPTRGFRVLEQACEIDVELDNPSTARIERAVELANNVIWEDRRITIKDVTSAEAAELPLRKEPAREGELRLIEIDGFDLTPCGGTHAYRTGEVGMILVRSWERAKGLTRIEFLAGGRALADYRRANNTARSVAALFSAGRDDAPGLAERMLEENKDLHRRLRALEEVAARAEATELLTNAVANNDGVRVITHIFDNRDSEFLKQIAFAIIKQQQTIALLASRDNDVARLVFARSADVAGDMNALMREACGVVDGRGGGKPDFAQGGGKNVDKLEEALKRANAKLAEDNLQTV
jgi:alanyl-tRNA synthetase